MSALPPKADILRCGRDWRYSITSSAMASTPGGVVSPSTLAVFMLMTSASQAMELSAGTSKTVGGSHASVIHTLHTWHSNVWIERTNRVASPQLGQHGAG